MTASIRRLRARPDLLLGSGLAAGLTLVAFLAAGGTELAANTWIQLALLAIGFGAGLAGLLAGARGRRWGLATLLAFAALAALTYASIAWSVQPAASWLEANRTLSYLAAFATALTLARLFPERWAALAGAVAASTAVLSFCALLYKAFPDAFDRYQQLGRLIQPLDYWNAVGLMAALGIPACLWAGARVEGARWTRTLAAPALAALIAALILSYSRGALIVAVVGVAVWFALVPLRLRAALILALGVLGGAAICAWALPSHNLTADYVPLSHRAASGHWFALFGLLVLVACAATGWIATGRMDTVTLAPATRQRVSRALAVLVALLPLAGIGALAASSRGLTGEVSHIFDSLTNTSGGTGDQPGRLAELSNSRPRYWSEGFRVGSHHVLAGAGALGFATANLRYSTSDTQPVGHAHSYLVETFADFGLVGVAVALALFAAWAVAARRPLRGPPSPERAAMVTLLAVALIFGMHSLIDWTWFIPGTAVIALVCAGWLAGRGPLDGAVGRVGERRRLSAQPGLGLGVVAATAAAVFAAWVVLQPLRSSDADADALTALTHDRGTAAVADARHAAASDPVSVDPLFLLAEIYADGGHTSLARAELVDATTLQPANPLVWVQLGTFDLGHHAAAAALADLQRAHALYPASSSIAKELTQARAAATTTPAATATTAPSAAPTPASAAPTPAP